MHSAPACLAIPVAQFAVNPRLQAVRDAGQTARQGLPTARLRWMIFIANTALVVVA